MGKESFDIIYSLGFNCDCASFLKKYNLRSCSGPFDWVGVSSFNQRIKLILSDFQDFLDYHKLERISPSDGFKDAYQNVKTNMSFRHDFDLSQDLSHSYSRVKRKYEKRINRFYKNIAESKDILFVYMANQEFLDKNLLQETLSALESKLKKNISFTVIQQDHSVNRGEIFLDELSPKLKVYRLDYYNSVEIIDITASKLLKKIFTSYECKTMPRGIFAKLLRFFKQSQ